MTLIRFLCQKISDLVAKVALTQGGEDKADDAILTKCSLLSEKLNALLHALQEESPVASKHIVSMTNILVNWRGGVYY